MHITTNTVSGTDFFYFLNGFDGIIKFLIVHSFQLTFFESKTELFAAFLYTVFQISAFG